MTPPPATGFGLRIRHGSARLADLRSKIASIIATSREELLALGLRNPLLTYHSSRARGVEVDELPVEVFRILVCERRAMSFEAGGLSALGLQVARLGPHAAGKV